jgi:beta-lactamase regulating signal transducer with metallopeptidase domain
MNEFCLVLLTNLLRTTAYLAASAILVGVLLKISRCQSPRVHRLAWCLVLLQGLLLVRIPWSVAWLPRPAPVVSRIENLPRLDEPSILPIEPLAMFSAPPNEDAMSVAPRPVAPELPSRPSVIAGLRSHWPILAVLFWLAGMVAVESVWIFRYVRFLQIVPAGEQGEIPWQQEFASVLGESNRSTAIDLRITDDAGPLICRRHGSYILLVPRPLWASLSSAERQSILRHEIGHYRRGDLWKSIAIQVLALPHWFNPFAWLAVRCFDEAAEWACDELATGDAVSATSFANTLLKICESTKPYGVMISAARGTSVTRRIRRLLIIPKEDSIMRKFIVCAVASLLLLAGGVQIRLVAEDTPAPIPRATPGQDSIASNRANPMVTAAEKAYGFSMNPPMGSSVNFEQAYTWSRRWLQAAIEAASNATEREDAFRNHRDRMKTVLDFVQERNSVGVRGFDDYQLAAAQFYLAEANLWLAQQSGNAAAADVNSDKTSGARIEVYPITTFDPELAVKAIQTMLYGVPDVRVAIDAKANTIVAQARPAEQARIRELLSKLDANSKAITKPATPEKPQLTQRVVEAKSPAELIKILQPLLAGQSRVEMKSLDSNSQLIVSAPAEQQEAIRALVNRLERPAAAAVPPTYHQLNFLDADAAMKILGPLVEGLPNTAISVDARSNALIVSAPSKQHDAIVAILQKLDVPSASPAHSQTEPR